MKKNQLTLASTIILIIFGLNHIYARTAHSTLYGGNWNDETTWTEGFIPGTNDTAIILGTVIVGGVINQYDIVHSYGGWVIVEEGGTLRPHEYGGGLGTFILYVSHDITNYGTLSNGTGSDDYEYLQLNISGDINNYGSWGCEKTQLTGEVQHLLLGEGNIFGSIWECVNQQDIYAASNLRFDCLYYTYFWNTGDFNLSGATLHMGEYSVDATGTVIYNGTLEGDFFIKGRFSVDKSVTDTLRFVGNITVTDTLENSEYGGGLGILNLWIDGNLINNGIIRDDKDGIGNDDRLSILITGDIINNGQWTCYYVNLAGDQQQMITQANGKEFDSYFTDLDSTSNVIAGSGITILQDFNLGRTTLYMENMMLQVNGQLSNGYVSNCQLKNAHIQNLTSHGSLQIYGTVTCDEGNLFMNEVLVNDTLQSNEYGGGSKYFDLYVDGNLRNDGVIRNISPGDMLRLYIAGDIINNGHWENEETILNGTGGQTLHLGENCSFTGKFINLNNTNNLGVVSNDLSFIGDFDLGEADMDMDGYKLYLDGWLYNGSLTDAQLYSGYLQNLECRQGTSINNTVTIDDGVYFTGNLTINDTIMPNIYGGGSKIYDVNVNGNLVNHGVIMNNVYGESLRLNITGNLTNDGEWINYLTHVNVSQDQYIELVDDKSIAGKVEFEFIVESGQYQWYYEDAVLDSPDFEGETSKVLIWNVPVSSEWYGNFYCETSVRETVGITVKKGYTDITENAQYKARIWSFQKQIYVEPLEENSGGEILVFDLLGRKICEKELAFGTTKIDLVETGYYLILVSANGKMASQKVFIE